MVEAEFGSGSAETWRIEALGLAFVALGLGPKVISLPARKVKSAGIKGPRVWRRLILEVDEVVADWRDG